MNQVQIHNIIMYELKRMFLKDTCIFVSKLAKNIGLDQRIVRRHLLLTEIDKFGYFADEDKKIFCKVLE